MGLTDTLRALFFPPLPARGQTVYIPPPSIIGNDFLPYVNFGGNTYGLSGLPTTMPGTKAEEPSTDFPSLVAAGYRSNPIIFACENTRLQVFSQARFVFQQLRRGQTGADFGNDSLKILERPWPGGTTGDLLTKMLTHADFGGTSFVTKRGDQLRLMRPDWVSIVLGSYQDADVSAVDLEAEYLGIIYWPGGKYSGKKPVPIARENVATFAPTSEPESQYRGMSWLSPVVREMTADAAATTHKLEFFANAGTPNMVVKRIDSPSKEAFREWRDMMEAGHSGLANAYKTLYLTAGADATVVGRDLQQLDFKVVQGAGETRIAAAAGVHPVIVGLSEGMQGSSLNAGNFNSARRLVADKTLWHLWANVAGSLETLVPAPPGSRLWIDDNVPFLREDRRDAAEIERIKSQSIASYIDKGFTRESAVQAVQAEDVTLLKPDPDWVSVQVQATNKSVPTEPPTNGKVPSALASPQG